MDCFGELFNNSPRRIVQRICSRVVQKKFIENRIKCFQEQKTFCLENNVFSHLASTYVRESERARDMGKGESHSHP